MMDFEPIKDFLVRNVFIDKQAYQAFRKFRAANEDYPWRSRPFSTAAFVARLNWAQYRQRDLDDVRPPAGYEPIAPTGAVSSKASIFEASLSAHPTAYSLPCIPGDSGSTLSPSASHFWNLNDVRPSVDELFEMVCPYDIISLDIFDTSLYRKVNRPEDVFRIMASEMGFEDFRRIRKTAEGKARQLHNFNTGNREANLDEIYDILEHQYNISRLWEQKEIDLELELSLANPYIKALYDRLLLAGKTVIFMSDMYLPRNVIENMLSHNGYTSFEHLYLSNDLGITKGNGEMQSYVSSQYPGKSIVHIGDNYNSDYIKTIESGMDAIYNPDQRRLARAYDSGDGNFASSYYRALINNTMNCGAWEDKVYYDYGFRVGGIIAAGYCDFINRIAREQNSDLILFCARDCDIIHKIYNSYYYEFSNKYISISRHSILGVTADRYLYDYIGRSAIKHANRCSGSKTIQAVLEETGFDYLVSRLEDSDIERFLFPQSLKREKLETFFFENKDIVLQHNARHVEAARQYYEGIVGNASRILIVDVGWSGTCISALKYFLQQQFPEKHLDIHGALMCTSRNDVLTGLVSNESIDAYIYSPFENMDLTRFFMPGGRKNEEEIDTIHMPVEYLFTSTDPSLVNYDLGPNDSVILNTTPSTPPNTEIILEMQKGMLDFCKQYHGYWEALFPRLPISPYLASGPLREAITNKEYCREIYGSFLYDASSAVYGDPNDHRLFGELFPQSTLTSSPSGASLEKAWTRGKVLFVSPEMIYTGAPQSLLRICRVTKDAGYDVEVWSAKPGPFEQEFTRYDIKTRVVTTDSLSSVDTRRRLASFDVVICNTIMTDAFVRACRGIVPVAWYIREATNIPDFCTGHEERLETLRTSQGITCVSNYAADAIRQFTAMPINIVHNAVEDTSAWALPYTPAKDGTVRFIQLGTIEYRKGYDLLIEAYKSMPDDYRSRAEVVIAGGFISSGASFASYLFSEISEVSGISYIGQIQGAQKKTEIMSQADVVVVASRDESCSLVALEGAMLSKPLIVTKNVGAKYMVDSSNGLICESGSVSSLRAAMMEMIDLSPTMLGQMGSASRMKYDELASMDAHRKDIVDLIETTRIDKTKSKKQGTLSKRNGGHTTQTSSASKKAACRTIISLTSHPGRVSLLKPCIDSLLNQSQQADIVILWLAKDQFPNREQDLPEELRSISNPRFQIRWTSDDLKPHKKYFYAMQEFPDAAIITVDDDVIYDRDLVKRLCESYALHPHAVSCMRANLILFRPDGTLRTYDNWIYEYRAIRDKPTYQLLPTGIGGVLYPPSCMPSDTFDASAIETTCLFCDDLWLKIQATAQGYPTVLVKEPCPIRTIEGSQNVGLWRENTGVGRNDISLSQILDHFEQQGFSATELLKRMRGIGAQGEWVGPDKTPFTPLKRNQDK